MRCPHCRDRLLQKAESGGHKLRLTGALTLSDDGQLHGQCYWCKGAVSVPIRQLTRTGRTRILVSRR